MLIRAEGDVFFIAAVFRDPGKQNLYMRYRRAQTFYKMIIKFLKVKDNV